MRAVLQRVQWAKVEVENTIVGEIQSGLMVLIGFEKQETQEDFDWMIKKIVQLRIFNDSNGIMNRSVKDVNGNLLIISQFTLQANAKKGNRPSYIKAAQPEIALKYYTQFLEKIALSLGTEVQSGQFGADMKVSLLNDGPVTLILDSKQKDF